MVVPELLGYGETDKPTDVEAYAFNPMCKQIAGILDAEGVDKVIGLGHDFGESKFFFFFLRHIKRAFPPPAKEKEKLTYWADHRCPAYRSLFTILSGSDYRYHLVCGPHSFFLSASCKSTPRKVKFGI